MSNNQLPAQTAPRPGQLFALNQPAYATNNWRLILGMFDDEDPLSAKIRYVKIFNRVATIKQRDVMIRTPIGLPDGFYELTATGELAYAGECDEDERPLFTRNVPMSETIARESLQKLCTWANWRREQHEAPEKCQLVLEQGGIVDETAPSFRFQFKSIENPGGTVKLPIFGDPVIVNAFHLRLALIECTRYDTVVIAHDRQLDRISPLFIGRNWNQCAVIVPRPLYLKHTRQHG